MLPDRVLNPGPLTYESGALPTALRGPASMKAWGEGIRRKGEAGGEGGVGHKVYTRHLVCRPLNSYPRACQA